MILSAHQNVFFPYEGTLDKLRASDRYVVLSHVQFERGNYINRFLLNERWYTMSVSQHLEPIINKRYNNPYYDFGRIIRKLPDYAKILAQFNFDIAPSLVDTNLAILRRICDMLSIKTEIVMDYPTSLTATDRLVDLCKHYGATTYLSGPSGPKYMQMEKFAAAGIKVTVQKPTKGRAAVELLKEIQ